MKIAIVHPSLAVKGGAENVVVWLATELVRRRHEVTVFTSDYDDRFYGRRSDQPFAIVTRDLGGYDMNPLRFFRAGWRLRHDLEGFDWVNPHNFPAYHWVYIASRLNRKIGPVVWFCEEPVRWFYPEVCNAHFLELQRRRPRRWSPRRPWWRRWASTPRRWRWIVARAMDRLIVPRLHLILTNSEFIAGQIRTIFHVEAVPCRLGVPVQRFLPLTHQGTGTERYLLTVSRLYPEKNIETILEALRIFKDQGPLPFDRYIVAGDGPLKGYLESVVGRLGLTGIVEFRGFVPEDELADLYRGALLVIYLPLDETFGLVLPEAALYRKAVIGPNHGGPREVIQDGVTGLLADPADPTDIAERIAYALDNPSRLANLGEQGYKYMTSELTFSRFVDRFEACLHRDAQGSARDRVESRSSRSVAARADLEKRARQGDS